MLAMLGVATHGVLQASGGLEQAWRVGALCNSNGLAVGPLRSEIGDICAGQTGP